MSTLSYRAVLSRYRQALAQRRFTIAAPISLVTFLISVFVVQPYAVQYATERASSPVTDIILSNIRVYDVDGAFVYGMFLLIAFIVFLCLVYPKRIPFTLYSLTLFILIRCAFVSMTHLAPFTAAPTDFGPAITRAFFGADLFFSGHTGTPFLMALIYWRVSFLRYLFLAWSVFFAVVVLLGHFHYSIDVASAFFITYGIFHISEWLFPEERKVFYSDVPEPAI